MTNRRATRHVVCRTRAAQWGEDVFVFCVEVLLVVWARSSYSCCLEPSNMRTFAVAALAVAFLVAFASAGALSPNTNSLTLSVTTFFQNYDTDTYYYAANTGISDLVSPTYSDNVQTSEFLQYDGTFYEVPSESSSSASVIVPSALAAIAGVVAFF